MKGDFVNSADLFKGSRKDNNNCTVRAFAVCMDCSYEEANQYLAENLDRVEGKGVNTLKLMEHLRDNSKEILCDFGGKKSPTYTQFQAHLMDYSKTYFILVRGHALAVKEGVIYGNREDAKISRKRLWGVYEF